MASARLGETVAVVTGASSGIGEATARALAAEGATVVLLARRRDRLDELVATIGSDGGTAHAHEVDVTDASAVAEVMTSLAEQFGRIDILVNNAGFLANSLARDADLDDWHRMLDVNVGGVLNTTHAALPHVVAAAGDVRGVADIVTVSSLAGRRVPTAESNVYSATKHAVNAFSEALRRELVGERVRVGVVEPGVVRSEMTTGGGKGAPDATTGDPLHAEDIADAIVYMVTRPDHVAVNEILIRPTEQER
ncbi:SDR family oxidoreductase [Williamsia herbipolensis]|uniref:SDR family oxidoreductase n=1 Tax=Williamsia herbipolensis TaxID=1603258 RepID=A0AAU4K0F4_9NOCA|nr:SDR family oxidoreductase [Williamsia herbipolensis]